jgi:tRNA(Met) C34 N-acetyltransferase TmcA
VTTFGDHLAMMLDPVAFAAACGLDELDDWQAELLRDDKHDWLVNTSRQSGKSTIAALKGLHPALYRPEFLTLLVSAGMCQASDLFKRCVVSYRRLGKPVVAESENQSSMTLENGSRIISLPSLPSTVRGFSGVNLVVIDEAAQVPDEMLAALMPTRALSDG